MSYTGYPKALEQFLEYNKRVFELKDGSGNDVDMNHILSIEVQADAPAPAPAPEPAPAPSDPVPVVFSEGDEVQYNADGVSPTTSTVDADGKLSFFISEYNMSLNITENRGQLLIPTAPVEAYKDDNSDYYYIFYSDGVWKMFGSSGSGQTSITEGTWEYVQS